MASRASKPQDENTNVSPDAIAGCYAEYASLMADSARNTQKIAAMFARWERSDGVDKDGIQDSYKLANKDPEEAKRRIKIRKEYRAILGIISMDEDGQLGLDAEFAPHVSKPSPELQQRVACARAHADGYNSGKAGGTIDACPYQVGSEEAVHWHDAWADGREDRIARNPDLENVTQAEPRKRGRPPGSKNKPKEVSDGDQTDLEEFVEASAILGLTEADDASIH